MLENTADLIGGAIDCPGATLINCVIARNYTDPHFAAITRTSLVLGCTVVYNLCGGIDDVGRVGNSIIWGNAGRQIDRANEVHYCDVQGGWPGVGNINADPLFADPAANDYHLLLESPCIDRGDPTFQAPPGEVDLDRQKRVWDRDGDLNCDGIINNFDIDAFTLALTDPAGYAKKFPRCDFMLADINADGTVDNFDIDPFVALLTGA